MFQLYIIIFLSINSSHYDININFSMSFMTVLVKWKWTESARYTAIKNMYTYAYTHLHNAVYVCVCVIYGCANFMFLKGWNVWISFGVLANKSWKDFKKEICAEALATITATATAALWRKLQQSLGELLLCGLVAIIWAIFLLLT